MAAGVNNKCRIWGHVAAGINNKKCEGHMAAGTINIDTGKNVLTANVVNNVKNKSKSEYIYGISV